MRIGDFTPMWCGEVPWHGDILPDLDDPATLGCIEHVLLPQAGYGPECHLTAWQGADGAVYWTLVYRPDPISFPGRWLSVSEDGHPSKAEALVFALEAAP